MRPGLRKSIEPLGADRTRSAARPANSTRSGACVGNKHDVAESGRGDWTSLAEACYETEACSSAESSLWRAWLKAAPAFFHVERDRALSSSSRCATCCARLRCATCCASCAALPLAQLRSTRCASASSCAVMPALQRVCRARRDALGRETPRDVPHNSPRPARLSVFCGELRTYSRFQQDCRFSGWRMDRLSPQIDSLVVTLERVARSHQRQGRGPVGPAAELPVPSLVV